MFDELNHSTIKFLFYLDVIPATAKAIKIRNVQNPYIMRAYAIEKHRRTIFTIQEKLLNFMKTNVYLKEKDNKKDAKIGDVSFMFSTAFEL